MLTLNAVKPKLNTRKLIVGLMFFSLTVLITIITINHYNQNSNAATITSISPNSGPTTGGTKATITGTDFGTINYIYSPSTFEQVYTTGTSQTITIPAGSYGVTVEVWGGGGGGGGAVAWWTNGGVCMGARNNSSGGGGSGAYSRQVFAGPVGGTLTYTVGAGGVGGTKKNTTNTAGSGGTGGNGIASTVNFNSLTISANGGKGGGGAYMPACANTTGDAGGTGGVGGTVSGSGDIKTPGNNGGDGSILVVPGQYSNPGSPALGARGLAVEGLANVSYGEGGLGCDNHDISTANCGNNPATDAQAQTGAVKVSYSTTAPTMTCTNPTVEVDGVALAAGDVTSNSDCTELTVTMPAHAAGSVDVTVDNGVDPPVTQTNGYNYYDTIRIDNVTPSNGTTAGQNTVTIKGDFPVPPAPTSMQEMTQAYCVYMSVGDTLTLPDARDGQDYQIRKLADNNCWMITNLKLGSTIGPTLLTDDDTNLTNKASYTLPQIDDGSDTSHKSETTPYVYGPSPADPSGESGTPNSNAAIASSNFYGYYYNWTAAIAEDDSSAIVTNGENAANSICPSGWRLARGGLAGDPTNEYDQLNAIMAGFNGNQDPDYAANNYGDMYYADGWISNSSFRSILSGTWTGTAFDESATTGSWWSSTVGSSASLVRNLHIVQTYMADTRNEYNRQQGIPLRCMSDGGTSSGLNVTFGGAAATVVSSSNTEIVVEAPAHAAGLVDVKVYNSTTSDTEFGGYFYYDPMTVTSISPNYGPETGNTQITLTGTNLAVQPVTFTQVSSGSEHTLALDALGNLYAWGLKSQGALGIGGLSSMGPERTPVQVNGHIESGIPLSTRFIKIVAGNGTSLAIDTDGNLYAWGLNNYGQIGNGNQTNVRAPMLVSGGDLPVGTKFADVSAGAYHIVALSTDGKVYTWGQGDQGEMGDGSITEFNLTPKLVQGGDISPTTVIRSITTGGYHTMAIDVDGNLYAWGENVRGQIGNGASGTGIFTLTPWRVNGGAGSGLSAGVRFKSVDAGAYHTLAIDVDDNLWSWGANSNGQIGNGDSGTYVYMTTPYLVDSGALPAGTTVREAVAGGHHSFAITADGSLYAWGSDIYGEIGNGSVAGDVLTPQLVQGGSVAVGEKFIRVSASQNNSSAIDQTGRLYTWGWNEYGQIGNGLVGSSNNMLSPWNLTKDYDFTVLIDQTTCDNITMVSITSITCYTPAHNPGLVSVTLDNTITSLIVPATCSSALPASCNGLKDTGESRNQDRSNILSGFLYEELYVDLSLSYPQT
ncbi:MAG: IPT/TIG domain-containing protein, partial [Candidatus Nomurabacteria bacterium]|nr:IPT/TIG domain-containing protein [Candidatus Nomurabacteria bacterium]